MLRIYLDTNVLAYSLIVNTNSWKIFRFALDEQLEVVISDYLIEETRNLVKRLHGKDFFSKLLYNLEKIPFKLKIYEFEWEEYFEEFSKIVKFEL